MTLTLAQKQALKADIDSSENAGQPNNDTGNAVIMAAYNADASPGYWVLKTALTQGELQNSISQDGTNFDWASPGGFIARSQGERDAYRMMWAPGPVNPSMSSVRAGFADINSGTGAGAVANRAHFDAMSRRKATRFEKLFAINTPGSGAGRGTTTDPDTLVLEGLLTLVNVEEARNS